jgi:hypothetical protein
MYQIPVLFPQVSARESWRQTVQIVDDDLNQPIQLLDGTNHFLYTVTLEIQKAEPTPHDIGFFLGGTTPPYYDDNDAPMITSTVISGAVNPAATQPLSIVDIGTIQIFIPKAVFSTLRGGRTYDVYMTVYDPSIDDSRQLFVGRIPVMYGGRAT